MDLLPEIAQEMRFPYFLGFLDHLKKLEKAQWAILIRKKKTGNLAWKFQKRMDTPPRWEVKYENHCDPAVQQKLCALMGLSAMPTHPSEIPLSLLLPSNNREEPPNLESLAPSDVFYFCEIFGESRPSTPTVHDIQYRGQILPWIKKTDLLGAYFGAVNPSILDEGYTLRHLDKDLIRDPEDVVFEGIIEAKVQNMRIEQFRHQLNQYLIQHNNRLLRSQENDENRNPTENLEVGNEGNDAEEPGVEPGPMISDAYLFLAQDALQSADLHTMSPERSKRALRQFEWVINLWNLQRAREHGIDRGEHERIIRDIAKGLLEVWKVHKKRVYPRTPWTSNRERAEWLENFLADTPPVEFATADEASEFNHFISRVAMSKYFSHPKEAFYYELKQYFSNVLYYCKLLAREDNARGGNRTYEEIRDETLSTCERLDDLRNTLLIPVEDPQ